MSQSESRQNSGKSGNWAALPKGFRVESFPGYVGNTPVTKRRLHYKSDEWITNSRMTDAEIYVIKVNQGVDAKVLALQKRMAELQVQVDELEGGRIQASFPSMRYEVDGDHEHDQTYWAVRACTTVTDGRHGLEYLTVDDRFVERVDPDTGMPIFQEKATH